MSQQQERQEIDPVGAAEGVAALIRSPAVRSFDVDREVPADAMRRLVEVARWTGSARNRQPWRFVEVRDRTVIRTLSGLGGYAQFVADAPVILAIASADDGYADTPFDVGRITQSLILAAIAAGLSCCPATVFPQANVDAARALLGLPPHWSPRHLLAVGSPAPVKSRFGTRAVPAGRLPVTALLTVIR